MKYYRTDLSTEVSFPEENFTEENDFEIHSFTDHPVSSYTVYIRMYIITPTHILHLHIHSYTCYMCMCIHACVSVT